MPVRREWRDCDVADKDINSSQFGNSTQFSVSIEFLTMKLNLFAVQAIGIADIWPAVVYFFQTGKLFCKEMEKY